MVRQVKCAMCGEEFTTSSPRQAYCSHRCNQRAYEGRQGTKIKDWFEPTRLESFYISEDARRAERNRVAHGGVL